MTHVSNLKCLIQRSKRNVGKLQTQYELDYSKRLVLQVDVTLHKFFKIYVEDYIIQNTDILIMYDAHHETAHGVIQIQNHCEFLLQWLPNCQDLDKLIDLSIIVSKYSRWCRNGLQNTNCTREHFWNRFSHCFISMYISH